MPATPFKPGLITSVLDAQYGSTGKGVVSAWLTKRFRPDILLTTNGRNSSHTVVDKVPDPANRAQESGRYVFKALPVGAYYNGWQGYRPLIYIGPGAALTCDDLRSEMAACGLERDQVIVHPACSVVTPSDIAYESGLCDFEGAYFSTPAPSSGTAAHGSTCSGAGAARARKSLRKGQIALNTISFPGTLLSGGMELINHFRDGATGLLDGSQGYLLSLYGRHYPHCTSRAVTLAGFFADLDLPPSLIGNVVAVARTFPIRINSKKWFCPERNRFLTWTEKLEAESEGKSVQEIDSFSGGWYHDQQELSWDELSVVAGRHIEPELTSLTLLPRRLASWSDASFREFLAHNEPSLPHQVWTVLTFLNYLRPEAQSAFVERHLTTPYPNMPTLVSDGPETDSIRPWECHTSLTDRAQEEQQEAASVA